MRENEITLISAGVIIIILMMPYHNVFAEPVINDVDGTVAQGQAITVSGSGFGVKAQAAPALWDTVDNIPSYSGFSNGHVIPYGGNNPWSGDGTNSAYCNVSGEQRNVHSNACYKKSDSTANYVDGRVVPGATKLYVSWWFKADRDLSIDSQGGSDHSSKYLRLSGYGGGSESYLVTHTFSWTQSQNYVYEEGVCNYIDPWGTSHYGVCAETSTWHSYVPTPGAWVFLEMYMDSEAKKYTIRANNQTVVADKTWLQGDFNFDYVWKVGWDGGGNYPPLVTTWIDDIYIDGTFQHVVIGNASTYAASTHFEAQPATAWELSSITLTVNQGSFADSSTAYLYVMDADGSVNAAGYPVKFLSACESQPVKIEGEGAYYTSLQVAYNAAATGQTILAQARVFDESLKLNGGINVTLKGGYNCGFSDITGFSVLRSLTIESGEVTIKGIILR
jgi:hypothetical protein